MLDYSEDEGGVNFPKSHGRGLLLWNLKLKVDIFREVNYRKRLTHLCYICVVPEDGNKLDEVTCENDGGKKKLEWEVKTSLWHTFCNSTLSLRFIFFLFPLHLTVYA